MAKRKPSSVALEIRDTVNGRTREKTAPVDEHPVLERARKAWNLIEPYRRTSDRYAECLVSEIQRSAERAEPKP